MSDDSNNGGDRVVVHYGVRVVPEVVLQPCPSCKRSMATQAEPVVRLAVSRVDFCVTCQFCETKLLATFPAVAVAAGLVDKNGLPAATGRSG